MNDRFIPRRRPSNDPSEPLSLPDVPTSLHGSPETSAVPDYLRDTYTWAYLSNFGTKFFDKHFVVQAILWGNADRLIDSVVAELKPGWRVLQPACVYGDFSLRIANALGPSGRLDVRDIGLPFRSP